MKFSKAVAVAGLGAGFVQAAPGAADCGPEETVTITIIEEAQPTQGVVGQYVGSAVTYRGSSYLCPPYVATVGNKVTSVDYGFATTTVYEFEETTAAQIEAVVAYYGGPTIYVTFATINTYEVLEGTDASGKSFEVYQPLAGNGDTYNYYAGSNNGNSYNSNNGNSYNSNNGNGNNDGNNSGNNNGNNNGNGSGNGSGNGNGNSGSNNGNGNGSGNGANGVTTTATVASVSTVTTGVPTTTPTTPTIINVIINAAGQFQIQAVGPTVKKRATQSTNPGVQTFNAAIGNIIRFFFNVVGQGVAQTSLDFPCTPFLGGFNTGINTFNPTGSTGFIFRDYIVTTNNTLVFYSEQSNGACSAQFVLVVNANGQFPAAFPTASSTTTSPTQTPTPSGGARIRLMAREEKAMAKAAEIRAKRRAAADEA